MSTISVNKETCTRCGVCIDVCPVKIIQHNEEKYPSPVKGAYALCIDCGHCMASCPHGALSHRSMAPDQCPPVRRELLPDPEQTEHFLRSRRSIRCYREETVERGTLQRLIEIARYAPSGHNSQPLSWTIIYTTDELKTLAGHVIDWMRHVIKEMPKIARETHMDMVVAGWEIGMDVIFRGAPHCIICHAEEGNAMAPRAATIALSYLELAAPSHGLGGCWAGFFDAASQYWPPCREAIGLPKGHVSLGSLMIGRPRYRYYRLPLRREPSITWK